MRVLLNSYNHPKLCIVLVLSFDDGLGLAVARNSLCERSKSCAYTQAIPVSDPEKATTGINNKDGLSKMRKSDKFVDCKVERNNES